MTITAKPVNVMQKFLIILVLTAVCGSAGALPPVEENIRQYCEIIQESPRGTIADSQVAAVKVLTAFYARRGFRPVWSDAARWRELLNVLQSALDHGLDPQDYHYRGLAAWDVSERSPRLQAERDILATDALMRYGNHLYFGKLDPAALDPDWNLTRSLHGRDPVTVFEDAVASASLADYVDSRLAPNGPFYTGLKQALARYRSIAASGGWPQVAAGPTLKPGESGARVAALRARLSVTDDRLNADTSEPRLFDPDLQAAVERFQHRHGLTPDGLVGRLTLRALNVTAQARVDQLRVNLERTRWVFHDLPERYLIVNIAGFQAYLIDHGERLWDSRVVVGTPYRKTPVFKAQLTYLVLNPTWTVPPTILKQDIIPALQSDPDYLATHGMVLLDPVSGAPVDLSALDVSTLTSAHFPYVVRQEPGPRNALGRIKFMFPNEHFVYLHDTPGRALFERSDRTFSSGCIRVEHPLSLAVQLLNDPGRWSRVQLEQQLDGRATQTVTLRKPITVFLVYWTAEPEVDAGVTFYNDVYKRDAAVLAGLRQPFRPSAQ